MNDLVFFFPSLSLILTISSTVWGTGDYFQKLQSFGKKQKIFMKQENAHEMSKQPTAEKTVEPTCQVQAS